MSDSNRNRRAFDGRIPTLMAGSLTMITLGLLGLQGCDDSRERDTTVAVSRVPAETFVIGVTGMHCDGCAEAITAKVAKIDGVAECQANWEEGTTTVLATPDTIPTVQESIARMGFTVDDAVTRISVEDSEPTEIHRNSGSETEGEISDSAAGT